MKPLLMFARFCRKGALMAQIVNNPVMLLILRYVLPYSLAIFTFFTIVDTAEQAYQKGNADRAWKKWIGMYGIYIGLIRLPSFG